MHKILIISNSKSTEKAGGLNSMAAFMKRSFAESFSTSNTNIRDLHGIDRIRHSIQMMRKIISTEIDIVYFNSIYYFEFLFIALTCLIFHKPYVIHSHGSLSSYVLNEKTFKKNLFRPILKLCVRHAKFLVFANHNESGNSDFNDMPYVTFRNYIFSDEKEAKSTGIRNLKEFVFISKIDWKYKGIDELLKAFKIFSEQNAGYALSIYGYGEKKVEEGVIDAADANIEKLINRIGSSENIKFFGPIYGQSKNEVISRAGAICLFSKTEALPLILTESISLGTVVLASSATNYDEVLEQSDLICDGTVSGVVKLFDNYNNNHVSNYSALSHRMRDLYNNKFSNKSRKEELSHLMAALSRAISDPPTC